MTSLPRLARVLLPGVLAAASASGALVEGLPGEEVQTIPRIVGTVTRAKPPSDSGQGVNWMAPPIEEQMARDRTLPSLSKGALFIPTFSEPRREPEAVVYNLRGGMVATGQTGQRILVDSGEYDVHFGSGVSGRRLRARVRVQEGQTSVLAPFWGGLLVETLTPEGAYIDGQYELIRMDNWVSYGRGSGLKEERLQDIKVWMVPPGRYRLSKVGEGFNSLRNFITVQINPAELHVVELIFDQENGGNLIAGGAKWLNTRERAGRHWTYGLRAGSNLGLLDQIDRTRLEKQSAQLSTDMRARARFDQAQYLGIHEIFFQNAFLKERGRAISTTLDAAQARATWVRRLNAWVGPYVRAQASTHLFPSRSDADTVYEVRTRIDSAGRTFIDTLARDTSRSFRIQPPFFPLRLAQGAGVNVEWLSRYELELSTQAGLAARQQISRGDYLARTPNSFEKAQSSYILGVEGLLNAKLRLSTQLTLDLRAEIFAENAQPGNLQLEILETDFRFFLTRHVELGYLFQISALNEKVANRFPRLHSVSLRVSFNY